jgi:hypothetical protein
VYATLSHSWPRGTASYFSTRYAASAARSASLISVFR